MESGVAQRSIQNVLGGNKVKCTTLCDQIVKQQQSVETHSVQQLELLFLTAKFKYNYSGSKHVFCIEYIWISFKFISKVAFTPVMSSA